ncbi:MAG: PIG-L deacetylase family protein [Armatimonadota bacterium]
MKILAVGAHPDDIEFNCAGTLAKYRRMGHEVAIAVMTNGEVGSSTLGKTEIAAIRQREATRAAEIIGAELYWMGYPDEFLFNTAETRLAFIDVVRQSKPDLIICPDPQNDYHPDHTTAGQVAWDTHVMATVPNIITEHPPTTGIPNIIYMDTIGGVNFIPNHFVDITLDLETKKAMLACHESQDSWMMDMYSLTGVDMMVSFAQTRGFQCGCRFAEAFRIPPMWPRSVEPNGLL